MSENTIIENSQGQKTLPNSTGVLVLGIVSIPTCFCFGIVGLILGVIAMVLAGKAKKLYESNPNEYTTGSYNNMKAGRVCAIIGICLSSLYFIYNIYMIFVVGLYGVALSGMPWEEIMNQ